VLVRRLGYKHTDVAKCLGRDIATLSSIVSRYSSRIEEHRELRKQAAWMAKESLTIESMIQGRLIAYLDGLDVGF